MIFRDRAGAGKRLAARLTEYAGRPDVLVLALPRGGVPVALGDDVSPNHAVVQIADGAMRMEAAALRDELGRGGRLHGLLLRYALAIGKQVAQTAACNRSHNVGERLARWLLMCQDRVGGDELRLTQEFIAQMLGTRRSGVSEAAILLQAAGLIRYSRGHITVLDRGGWKSSPASATRSSGPSSSACSASPDSSKAKMPHASRRYARKRADASLTHPLTWPPQAAQARSSGQTPG